MKMVLVLAALLVAFALTTLLVARWRESQVRAAFPPIGQFVEVDGLQVHYLTQGTGPDLVLIHGTSGNLRDFTFSLMGKLTDRYRVTVFDRPGLGYSDALPQGSISAQADHLAKAAKALGLQKPILLGHSYGGAVALAWAINHQSETRALITLAGPIRPWETPLDPLYAVASNPVGGPLLVPLITAYVPVRVARKAFADLFPNGDPPKGLIDHYGVELALQRSVLAENARQRRTLLAEISALQPAYKILTLPWEIVHGTADIIVDPTLHTSSIETEAPGARVTLLRGITHMVQFEAEAAVIAAIDRAAARAIDN
jgi:pimeloyl-ACP methyl ester carboxylesterase